VRGKENWKGGGKEGARRNYENRLSIRCLLGVMLYALRPSGYST